MVRALAGAGVVIMATAACGSGSDGSGAGGSSGSSASGGGTRSFTDDSGSVTIPAKPQRIVATGYAVPALVEADAPLVGISSWSRGEALMSSDVKARYDKTPRVAGDTAKETNYEAIAKAKPDVIIIGVPQPVLKDIDLKRLKSIAPVVTLGPTLPDAWKTLTARQLDAAGLSGHLASSKAAYDKRAGELKAKYAPVLNTMKFAHIGAYGDPGQGNFQREFSRSWGTNIAEDIGVKYPGTVKVKGGGSKDVSEYQSIEQLPAAVAGTDAISYSVEPDGKPSPAISYVQNSPLWKGLSQVKAGKTFAFRYSQAATYPEAMKTLDALDSTLAPLLKK